MDKGRCETEVVGGEWRRAVARVGECQTQSEAPSFEVASVKPTGSDELLEKMPFLRGPAEVTGALPRRAYHVKPDQISGPDWLATERYDIAAKVPPGTPWHNCGSCCKG